MTPARKKAVRAYRHWQMDHDGLPTVREIADAAGIDYNTARRAMQEAGQPFRLVRPRERADMAQRRQATAERLMCEHARQTALLGRPPLLSELASAAGMAQGSYYTRLVRGMGLEFSCRGDIARERKLKEAEERCAKENPLASNQTRATARLEKIYSLKSSGDPQTRPETLARAGEGYTAQDRVFITCPVCGMRRLIAPRMHPWWLRNAAGEAIMVCRSACTGRND